MKGKIKFSDLPVLIKSDRRYQIALVVLLVIVLWPFIDPSQNRSRTPPPKLHPQAEGNTGKTPDSEVGTDLVTAFRADLDGISSRVSNIETNVNEITESQKNFETRTAEIFRKVLERVSESEVGRTTGGPSPEPIPLGGDERTGSVKIDPDKLVPFGDDKADETIAQPPAPTQVAFIGPGDSVGVELLAGVNASTDGTPYPVVFKLTSNVLGPDGSNLPLGEARVVAAAQGSLTDSRALFRLTSMNVRLPNGRHKVIPVDGWIVGEDGIRGMSGVLIDPIGKAIGGAGMTGALAGLGEGIAQSNTTTTVGYGGQQTSFVSGNTGQYAAGRGLSSAANTWSDIIKDRLDLLVPVVQVLSGRQATAVFAKSVVVPDLFEELEEGDFNTASLD